MFITLVEFVPEVKDDDFFGNSITSTIDQDFIHGH